MSEPRQFSLVREADESGVSGSGRVLDGIVWHNGWVTVCWRTDDMNKCKVCGFSADHHPQHDHDFMARHGHTSVGVYPSWEAFSFIHIESHPDNKTRVEWKP